VQIGARTVLQNAGVLICGDGFGFAPERRHLA